MPHLGQLAGAQGTVGLPQLSPDLARIFQRPAQQPQQQRGGGLSPALLSFISSSLSAPRGGKIVDIGGGFRAFRTAAPFGGLRAGIAGAAEAQLTEQLRQQELAEGLAGEQRGFQQRLALAEFGAELQEEAAVRRTKERRDLALEKEADRLGVPLEGKSPQQAKTDVSLAQRIEREEKARITGRELAAREREIGVRELTAGTAFDKAQLKIREEERKLSLTDKQRLEEKIVATDESTEKQRALFNAAASDEQQNVALVMDNEFEVQTGKPPSESVKASIRMRILRGQDINFDELERIVEPGTASEREELRRERRAVSEREARALEGFTPETPPAARTIEQKVKSLLERQ